MGILNKLGLKKSSDADEKDFSDGFSGMDSGDEFGFGDDNANSYGNDHGYPTGLENSFSSNQNPGFGSPQGMNTNEKFDPTRNFREREGQSNHMNMGSSQGNPQNIEVLNKNIEVLTAKVDLVRSELENMNNRLRSMESAEMQRHSPMNEKISQSIQKRYNQW